MKRLGLANVDTSDLVRLFAGIGVDQDDALLGGDYSRFNRLFQRMTEVSNELKGRMGDQRRALSTLYNYPNIQVRLKAAKHTLAVTPIEARAQLQKIVDLNWFPQSGEAGMSLDSLERGIFKPT